jgi:ABC-2 type transport system permease protein
VTDVPIWTSIAVMAAAIVLPLAIITIMFRTGYRLKS